MNNKYLVAFSIGKATAAQILERLGTDSAEDLFLLMAQAHLPMPRLPEAAIQGMAQSLHQLPTAKQAAKTQQMLRKAPASEFIRLPPDRVNAFRGSGAGGGTQRLIAERKADVKRGK